MLWKLAVARYVVLFVWLTRGETLVSSRNEAWLRHAPVFVFYILGTTTHAFSPSQPGKLNGRNGATMTRSGSYSDSRKDASDQHQRVKTSSPKSDLRQRRRTKPKMRLNNSTTSMVKGYYLPYDLTIQALRAYSSTHADLVLPRRFVVPDHNDYPSAWHGVDLAGTVYDMTWWQMHVKHKPDRVAELNQLGFIWERLQPEWNLVLEALVTYSSLRGNLLVPFKFVVPYGDDAWPKATWGIALGSSVYRIRTRGDFLRGSSTWSRREQLDALEFVWDLQEYRFRIFYEALLAFAEFENGRGGAKSKNVLRVPTTFVVPSDSNWPRNLWGYKLGEKCTAVRQKGLYVKPYPQRQEMLASIGFLVGGNASLGWLEVVHAAAVFSQMNQRNLDVPSTFIVPAPPQRMQQTSGSQITGSDDAWPWPEYLWGFPLGQRLKDVRVKGAYLKGGNAEVRRRQLDALGFNWSPKRGRKPKHPD